MRENGTDSEIAGLDETRLVTEIEDIKDNGTGSRFFVLECARLNVGREAEDDDGIETIKLCKQLYKPHNVFAISQD